MFFYQLLKSNNSVYEIIIAIFAFLLTAMSAIILHECAHGYVALKMGDDTAKSSGRLTISPKAHFDLIGLVMFLFVGFGWAKPVPVNPNNFKNRKLGNILVSLAGIICNLLMAGIGLLLIFILAKWLVFGSEANAFLVVIRKLVYYVLIYGVNINMMLALFNFLPIFPLDGFNFINSFLPYGNKFTQFMYRYGSYCMVGLILISYILRLCGAEQFDIFYQFSNLIIKLINAALTGGIQ